VYGKIDLRIKLPTNEGAKREKYMNAPNDISLVEKLNEEHQLKKFRCGENSLDHFLRAYALSNQRADSSQTYVVHRNQVVIGYHSLLFGSISLADAAPETVNGMPPSYSVPVMLLARWAVDKREQGRGIGRALLKDAFVRTAAASDIGGLRAMLVDAIDDRMAAWYRDLGFVPCPVSSRKLMLSIQNLRASLAAG
jgi:GNAT superfamily N-acetyltransferase